MANQIDLVVIGSHAPGLFLKVNRPPKAGETVIGWDFDEPMDGGKGSNQAIAAARLGIRTGFVGCVGNDRLGVAGESWMRKAGVDLKFLYKSKTSSTGVGFIMLNRENVPAMVTSMGANAELTKDQVENALVALNSVKVMLTQFEIQPEVALHAAALAKHKGIVTVINPAPAPEVRIPLSEFQVADYLVPNEEEAKSLLGMDNGDQLNPLDMAKSLLAKTGSKCVMITLGEKGIVAADHSGEWREISPKVTTVDTSGAGDVFCAALTYGILHGWKNHECASWACKVAALSVTERGTIPSFPTINKIEQFIGKII